MENAKKIVGHLAADWIKPDMIVGIGTGSTVRYFINRLIERCREGLKIHAVCSSIESESLAKKGNIPLLSSNQFEEIDITVDGADEIDPDKRMIKGGGGALVREKILASSSKEMVVIIDESKKVSHLGKRKLPVEILPFCFQATIHKINRLGYPGELRKDAKGHPVITDNGNYIYDVKMKEQKNPKDQHQALIEIPGVLDTGLFFNLAGRVIVGYENGKIEIF